VAMGKNVERDSQVNFFSFQSIKKNCMVIHHINIIPLIITLHASYENKMVIKIENWYIINDNIELCFIDGVIMSETKLHMLHR